MSSLLIDKTTILFIIIILSCTALVFVGKLSTEDFLKIILFILGYVTKSVVNYARRGK